jgi:DNA-dependent RNA polymerase auxiliary subunit epsilon
LAFKKEECQALYLEIKNQYKIDQAHKKLNGELRLQITGLEQKIVDMEKHEKEMLNYP